MLPGAETVETDVTIAVVRTVADDGGGGGVAAGGGSDCGRAMVTGREDEADVGSTLTALLARVSTARKKA